MKAATLILSAAGLMLMIASVSGCNKGIDPNGPGNKEQAKKQIPSVGSAGGPGGGAGAGAAGAAGSAKAGPHE